MHRVPCSTANVSLIKHLLKLFSNEVDLGRPPSRLSLDESLHDAPFFTIAIGVRMLYGSQWFPMFFVFADRDGQW